MGRQGKITKRYNRKSDAVIGISNTQLTYFKKFFKKYHGEMISIENGVDFFKFINDPKMEAKVGELLNTYNLAGNRLILL